MGRDCFLVWKDNGEFDLEAVFVTSDEAEAYMNNRVEFESHYTFPPRFWITELRGGLFEQDTLP